MAPSSSRCLHHIIAQRAREHPQDPAVTYEGARTHAHAHAHAHSAHTHGVTRLTYGQLECAAERVAAVLKACGVHRDVLVAVHMERSIGAIVAMLGVMKAGGAYVPIDPTHPKDRQEYIVECSRAAVVITDSQTDSERPFLTLPHTCVTIKLDKMGNVAAAPTSNTAPPSITANDHDDDSGDGSSLAYVLFTSGSTGKPKGVCIEHRGVVNTLEWWAADLQLTPKKDVILGLSTLAFDMSLTEILLALISGTHLHMGSSAHQRDPILLSETLRTRNVTFMIATPATFEMLMAVGWMGDPALQVICAGEAFRLNLTPILHKCRSFYNGYGPTETSMCATAFKVPKNMDVTGPLPIGTPIQNTTCYVVDENMQMVPDGKEGELYIGGVGLARGYHNRLELTEEKFITNPWGPGRLYASGDVVMRDHRGVCHYVRRVDTQVKIAGCRIELGEIENVLQLHPDLQTAVVLARNDMGPLGTKVLVAYVQPKAAHTHTNTYPHAHTDLQSGVWMPESLQGGPLRAYLCKSLPLYMVPKHFVYVCAFALSPNGKIDRTKLDRPVLRAREEPLATIEFDQDGEASVAALLAHTHVCVPSTEDASFAPMLRLLTRIVGVASGMDVQPHYVLGNLKIDSLGTVVVVQQISRTLGGMRIATVEFFEHETIRDLAAHLHNRLMKEKPDLLTKLTEQDTQCNDEHSLLLPHHHLRPTAAGNTPPHTHTHAHAHAHIHAHTHRCAEAAASSERLIAGLRGLIIIWVMCDHSSKWSWYEEGKRRFHYNNHLIAMTQGLSLYLWWATAQGRIRWPSYFFNKAVGMFPVYYLGLLLSMPSYFSIRTRVAAMSRVPAKFAAYKYKGWRPYLIDLAWYLPAEQMYNVSVRWRGPELEYASVMWNHYHYFFVLVTSGVFVFNHLLPAAVQRWVASHQAPLWVSLMAFLTWATHYVRRQYNIPLYRQYYIAQLIMGMALGGLYLATANNTGATISSGSSSSKPRRNHRLWPVVRREALPWSLFLVFPLFLINPYISMDKMQDRFVSWFAIPPLGLCLMYVLLIEHKDNKSWLRRYVLESKPLCLIGDLTFTLYVLHREVTYYYLRMCIEGWGQILAPQHVKLTDMMAADPRWFRVKPIPFKVCGLLLAVGVSYVVQRYLMERMVIPMILHVYAWCCTRLCRRGRVRAVDDGYSRAKEDGKYGKRKRSRFICVLRALSVPPLAVAPLLAMCRRRLMLLAGFKGRSSSCDDTIATIS